MTTCARTSNLKVREFGIATPSLRQPRYPGILTLVSWKTNVPSMLLNMA